ncbi:hypothetical protein RvY_11289 [Ramazzottius varieornatus]|uniref:MIF4G domain-containing protein n=1 Tax=Ramazzottius varieornatus TaxID=947166 RepID=A0A1D1VFP0_RAMVA|nr:hypothetical protein RvY_11289 [Ramazzottius varieornatus]
MPARRRNRKTQGSLAVQKEIEKLQDGVWMWANTIEASFATLPAELMKLPIAESYDHLVATINELIEAALCNPQHHAKYVKLLLALSTKVKPKNQNITFHSLLVQQVQEYLDYVKAECESAYEQRGDDKGPVTPLDEDAYSKKERFLAFTQLVVNLYDFNIVSYSFMTKSCKELLPEANNVRLVDQVKLECLCMLLTSYTDGNKKSLTHINAVGPYITQLRKFCEKKVTSARVRTTMWNTVAKYDQVMSTLHSAAAAAEKKKQAVPKPQKAQPANQPSVLPVQSHSDPLTVRAITIDFTRGARIREEPTGLRSSSSCGSFHSATDSLHSQDSTLKSWALPILPSTSKQPHTATYDQLVEMYVMCLQNHQLLEGLSGKTLAKNCGLTQPDFRHLQWMKKEGSSDLAGKANNIHLSVAKFLDEAERSLQQHMRAYYETVEKAAEEKINELVESLPANSRADINKRAYEASLFKSH